MRAGEHDGGERIARLTRLLERGAVALLLLAALVPRARDLQAGFDRELEGFQGAFFALAAVNYERLGVGFLRGYPLVQIDLPQPSEPAGQVDPSAWYTYVHHPPTVPLLAHGALWLMGPRGWSEAWREQRAPEGIELPLRLPFLLLHMTGLWAFWWALRQSGGPRLALLGLGLLAVTPVSALYATLVNYENVALPPMLLGLGFASRFVRSGGSNELARTGACFALAGAVTYAPLLFAPALALIALHRPRRALPLVLAAGLGAALPLVAHALLSRGALESLGVESEGLFARARLLLAPMLDGTAPLSMWIRLQAGKLSTWFTLPLLAAALGGLLLLLARRLKRPAQPGGDVALALLGGGVLVQVAFYRHTLDPQHPFLLWLAPAIAALAATLLDALAPHLLRLRAGIAPLVVLTSILGMVAVQSLNVLRHELRAPAGALAPSGARTPEIPLPQEIGAELARLLPPRSLGLVPSAMGLNLAVSFYAWRSLWPIAGAADRAGIAVAERYGLAEAPRYLVLPLDPPASAREQVEALRADLVGEREPDASTGSWLAWRL